MQRAIMIEEGEFLTRLDNHVVQLNFKDLTSLAINKLDNNTIYYLNNHSVLQEINYNQCKNSRIKTKIRRFSKIIQRLTMKSVNESECSQSFEN